MSTEFITRTKSVIMYNLDMFNVAGNTHRNRVIIDVVLAIKVQHCSILNISANCNLPSDNSTKIAKVSLKYYNEQQRFLLVERRHTAKE